ncbi:MAG: transposase [Acidobacteria bacterium]|nr:transposase [Acidobacteriota bacterium]
MVFLSRRDRRVYLDLLRMNASLANVRILAYCLMPNHIHLVAVPEEPEGLAVALRRTHGRYAQYFNARKSRSGHLWQNRFYSCAMDGAHLWTAVRYVERNPVRAGLVERPEEFVWSSAAAHVGEVDRSRILDEDFWREAGGAELWRDLLAGPEDDMEMKRIRKATHSGQPLGDEEFRRQIEQLSVALDQGEHEISEGDAGGRGKSRCRALQATGA